MIFVQKLIRYLLSPNQYTKFFLRYLANKIYVSFFKMSITPEKGITLERGITPERGITQTNKKLWVSYFSIRNPYMKFQDPRMHGSKVTGGMKKCDKRNNAPNLQDKNAKKFQRDVTQSKFYKIRSKVNQVIYSSAQISIRKNIKAQAQILFEISC